MALSSICSSCSLAWRFWRACFGDRLSTMPHPCLLLAVSFHRCCGVRAVMAAYARRSRAPWRSPPSAGLRFLRYSIPSPAPSCTRRNRALMSGPSCRDSGERFQRSVVVGPLRACIAASCRRETRRGRTDGCLTGSGGATSPAPQAGSRHHTAGQQQGWLRSEARFVFAFVIRVPARGLLLKRGSAPALCEACGQSPWHRRHCPDPIQQSMPGDCRARLKR